MELTDLQIAERVARAVRWYRLGTGTTDIFDRFNAYWIGLESLNKPLQEALEVDDDPTTCPHCQQPFISTPTVSGIRHFISRYFADEPKLYKRMRDLRISIMHSKTGLDNLCI